MFTIVSLGEYRQQFRMHNYVTDTFCTSPHLLYGFSTSSEPA